MEFGAKLDSSFVGGTVRLNQQSFAAYNESEVLILEIKRYHALYGRYSERVFADKIYRNCNNWPTARHSGFVCSDRQWECKKDAVTNKKAEYEDSCNPVEVERAFSLAK